MQTCVSASISTFSFAGLSLAPGGSCAISEEAHSGPSSTEQLMVAAAAAAASAFLGRRVCLGTMRAGFVLGLFGGRRAGFLPFLILGLCRRGHVGHRWHFRELLSPPRNQLCLHIVKVMCEYQEGKKDGDRFLKDCDGCAIV